MGGEHCSPPIGVSAGPIGWSTGGFALF